jgi:hypothetical protein
MFHLNYKLERRIAEDITQAVIRWVGTPIHQWETLFRFCELLRCP